VEELHRRNRGPPSTVALYHRVVTRAHETIHIPIVQAWQEAEKLLLDADPEMKDLAEEEMKELTEQLQHLKETLLPSLLLPPSKTAQLSAILELKAGAGGDEASLFVEEVLRMYTRYATNKGWKTSILSKTSGNVGKDGLKDVTLEVKGEGAFGDFRFERGVHRVQRVPATESAGRVHTSTIAVVVSHVAVKKVITVCKADISPTGTSSFPGVWRNCVR
jgi:peptide chain release factor 1